jgi:hypothetical protein
MSRKKLKAFVPRHLTSATFQSHVENTRLQALYSMEIYNHQLDQLPVKNEFEFLFNEISASKYQVSFSLCKKF